MGRAALLGQAHKGGWEGENDILGRAADAQKHRNGDGGGLPAAKSNPRPLDPQGAGSDFSPQTHSALGRRHGSLRLASLSFSHF